MKYYIIAGEPSGDIYGSRLIQEIIKTNPNSEIRFWGGDLMKKSGGMLVKHYKDLAFMGFLEVLKNIFKILKNLSFCKEDILGFKPDKIIFIDYPGFNLRIAKWAKRKKFDTYFYISPQVWAWKENRVKSIKKYINQMYVILPFEKSFYEKKHNFKVHYYGHPLLNIIDKTVSSKNNKILTKSDKPIVAILPGSRKQEIDSILNKILKVVKDFKDYQFIIAGVNHLNKKTYQDVIKRNDVSVSVVYNKTYELLINSEAAIVTSGTATLETALIGTPQIVCYTTNSFNMFLAKLFVKINFISLVNLILNKETVKELIQSDVNKKNIKKELKLILTSRRNQIKKDYKSLRKLLQGNKIEKKIVNHIINN